MPAFYLEYDDSPNLNLLVMHEDELEKISCLPDIIKRLEERKKEESFDSCSPLLTIPAEDRILIDDSNLKDILIFLKSFLEREEKSKVFSITPREFQRIKKTLIAQALQPLTTRHTFFKNYQQRSEIFRELVSEACTNNLINFESATDELNLKSMHFNEPSRLPPLTVSQIITEERNATLLKSIDQNKNLIDEYATALETVRLNLQKYETSKVISLKEIKQKFDTIISPALAPLQNYATSWLKRRKHHISDAQIFLKKFKTQLLHLVAAPKVEQRTLLYAFNEMINNEIIRAVLLAVDAGRNVANSTYISALISLRNGINVRHGYSSELSINNINEAIKTTKTRENITDRPRLEAELQALNPHHTDQHYKRRFQ